MEILVANRQRTKRLDARLLKKIAAWATNQLAIEEVQLGIHMVGAREMARVHKEFMNVPGSTDVITFDHGSRPPKMIYGEIFICVDDAIEQAREFQTRWQEEVARYAIHGILHLMGYDDLRAVDRRVMKQKEDRLAHMAAKVFELRRLERN